jgi:hypothetical protein
MTQHRGNDPVSPELVLVDPELAASARFSLPMPGVDVLTVRRGPLPSADASAEALAAVSTAALSTSDDLAQPRVRTGRAWVLLAGVSAVAVVGPLLLGVRVEVGENPASAEQSVRAGTTPAIGQPPPAVRTSVGGGRTSLRPTKGVVRKAATSRRFAWAPVGGASGYHVEIFRASTRVFSAETAQPELVIPAHWTIGDRRQSLEPGEYRWYVWSVVSGQRSSSAIVRARLTVS